MVDLPRSVQDALSDVEAAEKLILDTGMRLIKAAGGAMYIFDHFAIATLNRGVALSSGFRTLINNRNMVAAGSLIRLHLDTALRYYASHLVDDWNAFADSVIRGEEIRSMVDKNGRNLTDSHLAREFDKKVPGVFDLYKRCCRDIHLSDVHMAAVLDGVIDKEDYVVRIKIGAVDRQLSDNYYVDACKTVSFISQQIVDLAESWISYKIEKHANMDPGV